MDVTQVDPDAGPVAAQPRDGSGQEACGRRGDCGNPHHSLLAASEAPDSGGGRIMLGDRPLGMAQRDLTERCQRRLALALEQRAAE